jgi:hypothetical protein
LVSKPRQQFDELAAEVSYVGKFPGLHKYVLQLGYYESTVFLLADLATGTVNTLQGRPAPSPKRGLVATLYQRYPFEAAPKGIEVFEVAAGHLRRRFAIAQEE